MKISLKRRSFASILINKALYFLNVHIANVFIGKGSALKSNQIDIGHGTRINGRIIIKGGGIVAIGNYCAIGDGVRIISSNHAMNVASIQLALQKRLTGRVHLMETKSGVDIGHDVWIGDAAIILPGVSVGNGAVIGAGAVVTRSVEPFVVVAGNPARPIGRRFVPEIADAFTQLQWWNWSESKLLKAAFLFERSFSETDTQEASNLIAQARQELGE